MQREDEKIWKGTVIAVMLLAICMSHANSWGMREKACACISERIKEVVIMGADLIGVYMETFTIAAVILIHEPGKLRPLHRNGGSSSF